MLERWSVSLIRARGLVIGIWILASALGLVASANLSGLLTSPLSVPNTDSEIANQILVKHYGENVAGTFTVVVSIPHSSAVDIKHAESLIAAAAAHVPTGRVGEQRAAFGILYANVSTSLDLQHAASQTPVLRQALLGEGLVGAYVTGPPALQHDLTPVLTKDLHRGEVIAIALALVLLIMLLGLCWAVALPLLVAGSTIAVNLGVAYVLAHHVPMVLYIPNVVALIALGLAIDYSLLIVHRFRQELADEQVSVEQALLATMTTAGRTVIISSAVVAVSLAILCFVPVPFLRSLGSAGVFVPLLAMLSALTLLPALLAILGRRGVRPVGFPGLTGNDQMGERWGRLAKAVTSRPRRTLAGGLTFLFLCATGLFWLQLTPGSTSAIPQDLPSVQALTLLNSRIGPGVIGPNQIILDLGRTGQATNPTVKANILLLAQDILNDSEVFGEAIGAKAPFTDATGRFERILVIGHHELGAIESQRLVQRLRDVYIARSKLGNEIRAYVGGAPAQGVDFLGAVYEAFPWIVLAALVIAFVLLARAFRSLVLALVSVALNLLSVSAAIGLLVVLTRSSIGSLLFGTFQVSQIEGWVPVFVFAVLFGLSMDYEVFLVTRMREFRDAGNSTVDSIVAGMARTGAVVSAAALIMIGAMSGLVFGHVAGLQELGIGLGLGILIDVTVVRILVLPSAMALLGESNWWLPERAAKLLCTKPPLLKN